MVVASSISGPTSFGSQLSQHKSALRSVGESAANSKSSEGSTSKSYPLRQTKCYLRRVKSLLMTKDTHQSLPVMIVPQTEKEMVSVERINEYMEVEIEQNEVGNSQAEGNWPSKGRIEFCDVSLFYGPMLPPALKNLSFVIPGGLQVGIAGRTGAGKSSVLNVLLRLTQPTTGFIAIDGIETSKVSLRQLRSKLAVVPQTPFLFEGTFRQNVDPCGNSTDHRIWEILEKCHLRETILSLGGLDTNVKEGGEILSLGQRQLLCLSRAFLQATKVLCLDECTANVDPQTSWILQRAIASECKGKTVITIAHRMQSIMSLDRVLILENGMLAEEGNPQALLNDSSSKFSSFVKASGG